VRESVLDAFRGIFDLKRVLPSLPKDENNERINLPTEERFSSCVHSFGEARMNWNELSSQVKEIIIGRSLQYCDTFSALELKNLLTG
jgi:hypothetical protein